MSISRAGAPTKFAFYSAQHISQTYNSRLLDNQAFILRVAHLILQHDIALLAGSEVHIPRNNTRLRIELATADIIRRNLYLATKRYRNLVV